MRPWMLMLLIGCGEKDDDTSESEASCSTWVVCCSHQCTSTAEYEAWLAEPYDCDVECDTASPGPIPGECLQDSTGTCGWQ